MSAVKDTKISEVIQGPTIGMLVGWSLSPLFLEACQHVASSYGARFFYFYPKQVDFEKKQIIGSYWRDGKWLKAIFPFPDVIYDRMRRKNSDNAEFYEALSPIPITHQLRFGVLNKIKVYQMIETVPDLCSALIPFQLLQDLDKTKAFIDLHPSFILKPLRGSNGENIITVKRVGEHYEVFDQHLLHLMSRVELDQLLAILQPKDYFVQQLVESTTKEGYPFHIRVHVMKDGVGQWKIVFILPSLSLTPYRKITNHEKTFRTITKWEWFLNKQFGDKPGQIVDRKMKEFAFKMSNFLESKLGAGFHEIGLDLGIDQHGAIQLFEANLNNVGMNFHEFEAAKHGIAYALSLSSCN
ncbi:YheC/YheD family protein [Paenibacillus oryzisoli]|uniref:ATP-grasp domain-containing protein n=1 Tax=Paenibacillus oryzisoli TaxID=1850517 RepID=A0A198AM20_9BACL|nr:YheC/YheD family protein [Paenibacillus oryzisoli]OAS22105.1 hypothetical protein A8708_33570 [Paenibacillus oryzisoli]